MYNTTEFLESYKTLEDWADSRYDEGISDIEQSHPDRKLQKELRYFRTVRNVLTHNPNGADGQQLIT